MGLLTGVLQQEAPLRAGTGGSRQGPRQQPTAHHGQVAQVLADLTPPLRGLQLQPLSRLFLPIHHGAAAVVAAVSGRGVEAGLEELPPLPQLRIPVQTQPSTGPSGG